MGNLVNGLGNPIKEAEEMVEEERDEELKFKLKHVWINEYYIIIF